MGHRFRVYTLNRRMGAVDPQLFSWGRGGCFSPFSAVSRAILRESLAPVSADGWCVTFVLSEQQSHESGHMHRGCSPCQNSLGLLPLLLRRKFWCPSPWARFCQHNAEHCPLPLPALCLLQQCSRCRGWASGCPTVSRLQPLLWSPSICSFEKTQK